MLTATVIRQGENNQDDKTRHEMPVVKRSPEIYRGLYWGRAVPVGHDDPDSGLDAPVGPAEQPQPHTGSQWSPLRRMLMLALIVAFLGLETQLFLNGMKAPETAAQPIVQPVVVADAAPAAAQPAAPLAPMPVSIELVYDASGGMLAPIEGTGMQRWDVAKDGLQAWLNSGAISLEASFGMHSFGQQIDGACGVASALSLAPYSFEQAYNGIADTYPAAGGSASIAASLRTAATDLGSARGPATIVLVASGAEGCGGNPAAEAAAFASQANRQVHVVGVAINDPKVTAELRDIAAQGNGQYVAVSNSDELAAALDEIAGK